MKLDWRKYKKARKIDTGEVFTLVTLERHTLLWFKGDIFAGDNLRHRLQTFEGSLTINGSDYFIPVETKVYPQRRKV